MFDQNANRRPDLRSFAGRSKGKPGGTSSGRFEGGAELRREAKRKARQRGSKYADSFFYRLKNPHKNHPDNFTDEELQMIGLGYDRYVRFMEKDDPNIKHPNDWYKYGEFGPYSWRGVVLGEPIRGRFSDERATMIGPVFNQEEWEKIEQFNMAREFQYRLDKLNKDAGLRHFWVFVRHPRWRVSDLPWEQWTLVSEVVLEAGQQRLDKWNLMGRLGSKARAMVTQCASWFRPDILYVKKPVYQCRFEPQGDFFGALRPFLDPETEHDHLCELYHDDGRVEMCTYFGGLCKLVRVNQKAFVDDVTRAYQKLSDDKKSKCLEFLLNNHPVLLLHPYTKEWKAKLEEMELGCDASDDESDHDHNEGEVVDWIEDEGDDDGEDGGIDVEDEEEENIVLDAQEAGEDELGMKEDEDANTEENPEYWTEQFSKAMTSNEEMEKFATRYIKVSDKFYEKQMKTMEEGEKAANNEDGDEIAMRKTRGGKVSKQEWRRLGYGPFRKKIKKSKVPPGLFLRAAVRPFTYRNLVKEITLLRHAIIEGEM